MKKLIIQTIIFITMTTSIIIASGFSKDINHIFTGIGYDYSYIQGNTDAIPCSTEISVNGTIERNFFGKYEFIGVIKIEDKILENNIKI